MFALVHIRQELFYLQARDLDLISMYQFGKNINSLYSGGFPHTHVYNEYWIANFVLLSGHRYTFLNFDVILSLKFVSILASSADPNEMQQYAAFHQGLCCLQKYPLRRFWYTKV